MENIINILTDFEPIVDEADNSANASAVSLNPNVTWAEFIFTDDLPNGNKQRIPVEEYNNVIKTGVHMPIKMATGRIEDGHDNSVPLGTIAQLKIDGNKVIGLAALWLAERPEDVKLLKEKNKSKVKPQLSWEVYYKDKLIDEETQVATLQGVCVRATTIVGMPAYAGRTPILAMASDGTKPMEEQKVEMEELQKQIDALKAEITTLTASLAEKEATLIAVDAELATLREYKTNAEQKEANEVKMAGIVKKFADAGLEKSGEYFVEKRQQFLGLEESEIDFLIQELAAFAPNKAEASKKPGLPNLSATSIISTDPKDLAKALLDQVITKK